MDTVLAESKLILNLIRNNLALFPRLSVANTAVGLLTYAGSRRIRW